MNVDQLKLKKNGFFETSLLSSHVSSCPSIVFLQHLFTQNIPLNHSESISMQTAFHLCGWALELLADFSLPNCLVALCWQGWIHSNLFIEEKQHLILKAHISSLTGKLPFLSQCCFNLSSSFAFSCRGLETLLSALEKVVESLKRL